MLITEIIPTEEVSSIDLDKYAGKWFVIASIPTIFDRSWNFITESYTLDNDGNIDVHTTFARQKKSRTYTIGAKAFPDKRSNNFKWKVQFVWPFTKDYVIEEIAPDYSYAVVGHPKKEFLYIMSRNAVMDEETLNEIISRCKGKGYQVSRIRRIPQ
jgi:apolipoprotein D and lipocalin family protein